MSKIAFINGSPRATNSLSAQMIDYFCQILAIDTPIIFNANKVLLGENASTCYKELLSCKAIVIVSPLYVDALPSHLLLLLQNLAAYQQTLSTTAAPILYGFMNCGFIEGSQNHIALSILENYAIRMNWIWGGGVGLGGGEMFKSTKDRIPKQAKMMQSVYEALDTFTTCISTQTAIPTPSKQLLVNQKFSKLGFIVMGSLSWITGARQHKVNCLQLFRKKYTQ